MADEQRVEVPIVSTFDATGTRQATDGLKTTEAAAHGLREEFKELGWSAENIGGKLKGMLLEMVALAEVVSQFKDGWEEFVTISKAWAQLEMATNKNGQGFKEVKGEIEELAEGFAKLAGVQDEVSIPAMVKLYGAYGNMKDTADAANLTFAVSRRYGLDFAEAMNVVMQTSLGATRGLRDFGISVDEGKTKGERAAEGLRKLAEESSKATVNTQSLSVQTAKLGVEWENIRGSVVERIVPAILWSIKALKTAFDAAGAAVATIASEFMLLGDHVVSFGALLKNVFTMGPREAAAVFRKEWTAATEEAAKRTTEIWDKAGDRYVENWKRSVEKVAVGVSAGLRPLVTDHKKALAEIDHDVAGTFNRWIHGIRQIEAEERRQAEERRRRNEQWFEYEQRKEKWLDHLAEKVREENEREIKLAKEKAEAQQKFARDTALAGMGTLADYFGMSKEFALAEAVINTYEGATKALAQGGIYGPILAAIVIAAGMAQVATIASTEPAGASVGPTGKGFDDPSNDRAAYLGGRRWAADMIGEFTKGVSRGWSEGMAVSRSGAQTTTVNNSRTVNVHMHGAGLIDPTNTQMLKTLKRNLDTIDLQVEQQRVVGRLG